MGIDTDTIEIECWLEARSIHEKETFKIDKKQWKAMSEDDRQLYIGSLYNTLIDEKIEGEYRVKE